MNKLNKFSIFIENGFWKRDRCDIETENGSARIRDRFDVETENESY